MNKDRIEIDGEWYVKESTIVKECEEQKVIDPVFYYGATVESSEVCFEFSVLLREDGTIWDGTQSVTYTEKKGERGDRSKWKEDYWDNNEWLKECLENKKLDRYEEVTKNISKGDEILFIGLLSLAQKRGWL
jgi:hypothetical protein